MMICPQCRNSYTGDNLFCLQDGTRLVDENEQPTVVRPYPQPAPRPSPVNNILMGVLGGCVVLILVLIYFLARGPGSVDTPPAPGPGSKTPVSSSPSPTAGSTVENKSPVTVDPTRPPPSDKTYNMPEGVERTYRGTSYVNGNLSLTLTLRRDGNRLTGSAETPGDWDDLYGTIEPDGTFNLAGDNRPAGRVTGNWRGRIDKAGKVNGVWTSNKNGKRVPFSAE